jgi:hypothetical protein
MNRFLILVSLLLLASAIPAHASGITDPFIGMDDPPNCDGGTPVFGAFMFSSNPMGGGFSCFVNGNADSPTITSVDIETSGNFFTDNCSPGSNIVGFSNAFDSCSVTYYAAANVTDIRFFEASSLLLSIAPGAVFEADLNNSQSCSPTNLSIGGTCMDSGPQIGGWGSNQVFGAETNLLSPPSQPFLTPEPPTGSLLALGVLGLLAIKRKKFGELLRSV